MSLVRTIQLFIFILSLGVGILGLLSWEPARKLGWADAILSSVKNEAFRVGVKIEDDVPADSQDRVIREVAPPSHNKLDYVVCEIDDDPEQVNAFGLYHPADIAITLHNLKKQGVKRVFLSTHLHWPECEPEETNTLATALEDFDSVVVSAPLRRNLSADSIPPSFILASIPIKAVHGDIELLPVVNSLSIAPNVVFPSNTYAGFSMLESEKPSDTLPLVARWHDRIVFSALILGLMQEHKITPNQISVHPGKYVRIGNTGNILPIDAFGHFQPDLSFTPKNAPRTLTSALSGEASIIGSTQKSAILTATGDKSSQFEAIGSPYQKLSQLAHSPRVSGAIKLKRIPLWLECVLLADVALLAAWLLAYRSWRRNIAYLATLVCISAIFLVLYHVFHYWSPLSIYVLTLLAGWTLSTILAKPARRSLS